MIYLFIREVANAYKLVAHVLMREQSCVSRWVLSLACLH